MNKLTIGLLTYDDFDGAYFTVQALRLYHPEAMEHIELLILDNHPSSKHGHALTRFSAWLRPCDRLIPIDKQTGTAQRNLIFEHARTPAVLCLDSHVLLAPGALTKLLAHFDADTTPGALLQGPLILDNLTRHYTHFDPKWQAGMWGVWAEDERGADLNRPPFDIPSQGLGLFACRKADWQGFNPAFRGFGGEEGYIHEKFRQAGQRTLCLPWLRWLHRFERPNGIPYPINWEDRIFNYLLGHLELGLPIDPVLEHFRTLNFQNILPDLLAQAQKTFQSQQTKLTSPQQLSPV